MRFSKLLILGLGVVFLICGCESRDEVLRVTSPDGRVDALVFEENCGVPCSFAYEVELVAKGDRGGEEAALLEGAVRGQNAWGVNLNWIDSNKLSVEYLRAENAKLLKQTVRIGGRNVTVSLHSGVIDPAAPAGGMLYNRKMTN